MFRLTHKHLVGLALSALLALLLPAFAGAARAKTSIVPAGAVARRQHGGSAVFHPGGALRPKKQIAPRAQSKAAVALPASVDLSAYSVAVGNQGSIGSCVTWTVDYAILGWYSRRYAKPGQPFNPMYTYSQIHLTNATDGGGSRARDALNVALNQGNDTMAHYSHSTTDFSTLPNASERANAATWRISGWQTLFAMTRGGGGSAGATAIQTALAAGKPVAIALPIRPGFDQMAHTATVLDTDASGSIRGYHEVTAVGYDSYGVWIQNSWGSGWGYNGYGRLSWNVVEQDVYEAETISGFPTASSADTIAPTLSGPREQVAVPSKIGSSTVPVSISWSATDASGVAGYQLWISTNGGGYVRDTGVTTQTEKAYSLVVGNSYTFAVRAVDSAGNWSGYQYTQPLSPSVTAEQAAFPRLGGGWTRYTWASAFGGTAMTSMTAGDWAQFSFTGRDVALVAPKFSAGGRAQVYCDGTFMGYADEYAAALSAQNTVFWCRFSTSATHTMKVVVEGTAGRPRFDIEAFAVLK